MASFNNFFIKNQKVPKEEDFDTAYYNAGEELATAEVEEKQTYEKPASHARTSYSAPVSAPVQMKLIRPATFGDGQIIANCLIDNHPVLMHLEHASKEVAHDLVCFLTGVVYAIGGQIQPVSVDTYMLSPKSMEIAEEEVVIHNNEDDNGAENYNYAPYNGVGGYNF